MREYHFYVYMVRCSDGSYYTGVTNSYERRVREHNEGKDPTSYTFKRQPVELVYSAHFTDVYEAIHWEKVLKGWSRKKKEALMEGNSQKLHELAACRNDSHYQFHANKQPPVVIPSVVIPSGDEG